MNILENYNTSSQKYVEEMAEIIRSAGIPDEYVYIACKYYKENSVPIKTLKLEIRQWMSYIRNLGNETFDLSKLDYRSFKSILTKAIQKAMKPNPIYDNGVVFVGEFKTKEDALLYPIPNNWCTSNYSSKFNKYTQGGYRLFIIENKTLDEPLKYVCASVFMGNVKYWNTEGFSLFEELRSEYNINDSEHQKYQATLPKEVISYLYDIAATQTEERENKIKSENKEYKSNKDMKKEAYCPNMLFDNSIISIGEFKTLDDAINFPLKENWFINRRQDNKFNSYKLQGYRILIICSWNRSIQDPLRFVVALIHKDKVGKPYYLDMDDLPLHSNEEKNQYEDSLGDDAIQTLYQMANNIDIDP